MFMTIARKGIPQRTQVGAQRGAGDCLVGQTAPTG